MVIGMLLLMVGIVTWGSVEAADVYYNVPTTAYPTIQSAIDAAMASPAGVDNTAYIRVAQGTYEENLTVEPQAHAIYNIEVQGGYSSDFQTRELEPSNTVIDGTGSGRVIDMSDLFFSNGLQLLMKLEGLTVTGGANNSGAGVYIWAKAGCDLIFDHVIFENNIAESLGGGLNVYSSGSITIQNCTIRENKARFGAGIHMVVDYDATVSIVDCVVENNADNKGDGDGSGIYLRTNDTATALVKNNIIRWNSSGGNAGFNMRGEGQSSMVISNNLINANQMANENGGRGGALHVEENGKILFSNNTVTGNESSSFGGGIAVYQEDTGTIDIVDSIIWGNSSDISLAKNVYVTTYGADSQLELLTFSNSLFNSIYRESGWTDNGGNITGDDADPLFVTGPAGDYYLSQVDAGQDETSPCVDTGSDTAANLGLDHLTTRTDLSVDTNMVDMGYHYPTDTAESLPGDVAEDGDVDGDDLAVLAYAYGSSPGDSNYVESLDIDDEPGIGKGDLDVFAQYFGAY